MVVWTLEAQKRGKISGIFHVNELWVLSNNLKEMWKELSRLNTRKNGAERERIHYISID